MDTDTSDDALVIVAALVSRVEALVVASMLEAAGVQVCVGGSAHASVAVNSLALGGHRLWVPASQHEHASNLILEVLGRDEWGFSPGLQRAVFRVCGAWGGLMTAWTAALWLVGQAPVLSVLVAPLSVLGMPVNPQGRGDYYLHGDADYPAA
jgi:hypothetical protein